MKWIKYLSYFLFVLFLFVGIYLLFFYFPANKQISPNSTYIRDPEKNWQIYLEHARIKQYLHQYEEAELEYLNLLKIKPNDVEVKIGLATILYYQKKYLQALNILQTIPTEEGNDLITLLQANINLSLKNYSEAEILYRKYIQKFPTDQNAIAKLAQLLSWRKKYEEAIQLYQYLLTKDPQNIQIQRQYAKMLIWMGKKEEGANLLKRTLPKDNKNQLNKEE